MYFLMLLSLLSSLLLVQLSQFPFISSLSLSCPYVSVSLSLSLALSCLRHITVNQC